MISITNRNFVKFKKYPEKFPSSEKYFKSNKNFSEYSIKEKSKKNLEDIWKKNFFKIIFYVKIFTCRLKQNMSKIKLEKMKNSHYSLINDQSHIAQKEENSENYKFALAQEYKILMQNSHTYCLKIKMYQIKFCKNFKIISII